MLRYVRKNEIPQKCCTCKINYGKSPSMKSCISNIAEILSTVNSNTQQMLEVEQQAGYKANYKADMGWI